MGARDPDGLSTRLTVVGCGTAAPDGVRVCSGYLLQDRETRILFDCGAGVVHNLARFALPWARLTHVALTHFHTDHIGDLPMLLFALQYGLYPPRDEPLTLIGPEGLRARLQAMAGAFGEYVSSTTYPLHVIEVAPGDRLSAGSVELHAARTRHTGASLAYRAAARDLTLGYTGDTGPLDALGDFMHGVDELIAECSLPDHLGIDIHLTPASLARLAVRAAPGRLVVTHVYPQLDREAVPALLRDHGWSGRTAVAADGLTLR